MFQLLKKILMLDKDPTLTKLKQLVKENPSPYAKLNDTETAFLMLRLAGYDYDKISAAIPCARESVPAVEIAVEKKLAQK